jgi:hypothetical protein
MKILCVTALVLPSAGGCGSEPAPPRCSETECATGCAGAGYDRGTCVAGSCSCATDPLPCDAEACDAACVEAAFAGGTCVLDACACDSGGGDSDADSDADSDSDSDAGCGWGTLDLDCDGEVDPECATPPEPAVLECEGLCSDHCDADGCPEEPDCDDPCVFDPGGCGDACTCDFPCDADWARMRLSVVLPGDLTCDDEPSLGLSAWLLLADGTTTSFGGISACPAGGLGWTWTTNNVVLGCYSLVAVAERTVFGMRRAEMVGYGFIDLSARRGETVDVEIDLRPCGGDGEEACPYESRGG